MESKDLQLQQVCNEIIYKSEDFISRVKAICVMPDIEEAIRELAGASSGHMMACADATNGSDLFWDEAEINSYPLKEIREMRKEIKELWATEMK